MRNPVVIKTHSLYERELFRSEIEERGYFLQEKVLDADFVRRAKAELEISIEKEAEYHGTREHQDYGMVLLCALYGGTFIELFDRELVIRPFEELLGPGCIVYSNTSTSMPPHSGNYATRIHVDCPRIIPGYLTTFAALILLDDFTLENGATHYLAGSHHRLEPPPEREFFESADRLVARAGSVLFWNPRLWHAGGKNTTGRWRHALTIVMCRPYMKQRLDIPRAMENMDTSSFSPRAYQKLGFLAQVPANYDEYYAPPEKRKFRQKTE
jgi:ectoine hydroxylase-related dioxygenase (phytanoyl-CoA dioxygenase family)